VVELILYFCTAYTSRLFLGDRSVSGANNCRTLFRALTIGIRPFSHLSEIHWGYSYRSMHPILHTTLKNNQHIEKKYNPFIYNSTTIPTESCQTKLLQLQYLPSKCLHYYLVQLARHTISMRYVYSYIGFRYIEKYRHRYIGSLMIPSIKRCRKAH